MALSSPPTSVAPFDKGRLAAGISASATSLTVSPIYKTVNGVRVKQGINTTSGCAIISQGDYTELVTYTGCSVDATTKVSTISGLTRGRDPTQTTSSASFAGGTGRIWPKGAKFTVVADATYFQSSVFTNVANTFTATQAFAGATFSQAPTFAKGTHTTPFADTTARDAYFTAPTNGDECYVTGIGKQVYTGGAWVTVNASGTSIAANTTAGTLDVGTTAEIAALTANDATSGAPNALTVGVVSITTATSGKIPALNSAGKLDVAIGGTGLASPTSGGLLVGAGSSAMTVIGPGTTGQVPVSNGTTIAMGSPPSYEPYVYWGASASAGIGASSTSIIDFDTHTYSISANYLTATTGFEFFGKILCAKGAGTGTVYVTLGTTNCASAVTTTANGEYTVFRGSVMGTAAAGASVAVRTDILAFTGPTSPNSSASARSDNLATNGTLALKFSHAFGTSNGANLATLYDVRIKKISSTTI